MEPRSNHDEESLIGGQDARGDAGGAAGGTAGGLVTVRFFAGARAAAGVTEDQARAGLSLDGLTAELTARHGERLSTVLKVASFLVDGVAWHDRRKPLPAGVTVDVLPPFAGG